MFRPHTSPLYNYPYAKRQSVVSPHIPLIVSDFDEHQDYLYAQYDVHLGFSQTCLEQSLFTQIARVDHVVEGVVEMYEGKEEEEEEQEETSEGEEKEGESEEGEGGEEGEEEEGNEMLEFECEESFISYEKLKFTSASNKDVRFSDWYEEGVFPDKIIAEVVLKMDPTKMMSRREQTAVYEFMESVGGMFHILELICEFFAGYFSETFIVASLASKMFIMKKHEPGSGGKKSKRKEKQTVEKENNADMLNHNLDNSFQLITWNWLVLPFDNLLGCIVPGCGCQKRRELFEKCEEKVEKQMDIVSILKKVNRTNDMLLGARDGLQKKLYQYTKNRVVEEHGGSEKSGSGSSDDEAVFKSQASDADERREDLYAASIRKIAALGLASNMQVAPEVKDMAYEEIW